MKAHVIFDDDLQAFDFIIAEIQRVRSFNRDFCALFIVTEESNPSRFFHGLCGGFRYIVI